MIPNDCMMSAILKPNMILLYGEHRPLSERMIIAAMVDEAVNDMEAVHVLIICAADMVLYGRKYGTDLVLGMSEGKMVFV